MKATIIDWVKKIVDIEGKKDEYIEFWKTNRGLKDIRDEKVALNPYEIVDVSRKVYQRIIISYPKKKKREIFYVAYDDAQEVLPIINALVDYKTKVIQEENRILFEVIFEYKSRWVNKIWDWVNNLRRK